MNYLKFKMLTTLLFCASIALYAQKTTVSAGGDASGNGGEVSYSVGQVVTAASIGTGGTVTQGVQQGYEISEETGISETGISLSMVVYPNPTTDVLQLKVDASTELSSQAISYQLFDVAGKLLQKQENLDAETQIEMSDYMQGTYFLKIVANSRKIKSFKIVKN